MRRSEHLLSLTNHRQWRQLVAHRYPNHSEVHTDCIPFRVEKLTIYHSVAEMMIGVICACMPSLAYCYRHAPFDQRLRRLIPFSLSSSTKEPTRTSQLSSIRFPQRKQQARARKNDQYVSLDDYPVSTSNTTPDFLVGSRASNIIGAEQIVFTPTVHQHSIADVEQQ
jgi:hypothetical protein